MSVRPSPPPASRLPAHPCIGIVRDDEGRTRLLEGLKALGLGGGLWVIGGRDAAHGMQPQTPGVPLWTQLSQSAAQLASLASGFSEYEAAARGGAWIVAVQLVSADQRNAVRDLFARSGGHALRYFGEFGTEDLLPQAAPAKTAAQAAKQEMVSEGGPLVPGQSNL